MLKHALRTVRGVVEERLRKKDMASLVVVAFEKKWGQRCSRDESSSVWSDQVFASGQLWSRIRRHSLAHPFFIVMMLQFDSFACIDGKDTGSMQKIL